MKIALKIGTFVLVVGLAGWAFFYLLKGVDLPSLPEAEDVVPIKIGGVLPQAPETPTERENNESVVSSSDEKSLITKLSNGAIFAYTTISDDEIYYISRDGKVFQISGEGDVAISEQEINALNSVSLSQSRKRALVSAGNPKSPSWNIYDFLDRVWRPLPQTITYAAWGADDQTLWGIEEKEGKKSFVRVNLSRNTPTISVISADFRMKDVGFIPLSSDSILIHEKSSAFHEGSAWKMDTRSFAVSSLFRNVYGLVVKMFGPGNGGIAFETPNRFFLLSDNGTVAKELSLRTIPEKCGARGGQFYCFVPSNVPDGVVLPDDYFKNTFFSVDALYRVDGKSGESAALMQSGSDEIKEIDGESVTVSEKYLYFMNKHDGALYRLNFSLLSGTGNNESSN